MSWTLQVDLSLHVVAPNVTALLMNRAAVLALYIHFGEVQMSAVMCQIVKNKNQKYLLLLLMFLED